MSKVNLKNIKNIIFDLGGVLLDIDIKLAIPAFSKIGITLGDNFDDLEKLKVFELFEKGTMDTFSFRNELRKWTDKPLSDGEIDKAWNSIIIDFPDERIKLLNSLKSKYRIYLLSNTNEIHEKYYDEMVKNRTGNSIRALFQNVYYSHVIHLRKPDIEAFQYIIRDCNLNPKETLFIDDFINNIKAAKKTGLHTRHLKAGEELSELLID